MGAHKAEEFDPDRFIDDRKILLTSNPFMFLPFNAGPRICLGQQVRDTLPPKKLLLPTDGFYILPSLRLLVRVQRSVLHGDPPCSVFQELPASDGRSP